MRNVLICLMLCVTSLAVAQKVVFKKGKVLYDKVPIANVEDKKGVYTISTLENEPVIVADPGITNDRKFFVRVNLPEDSKKVVLVPPTHKKWSMSNSKIVIDEFTFGTYKIFTPEGIDKEAAKAIMTYDDSTFRAELEAKRKEYEENTAMMKEYSKSFDAQRWTFNSLGEFGKGSGDSFVPSGKVTRYKTENGFNIVYDIYLYDNAKKTYYIYGRWNEKRDGKLVLNNGNTFVLPASFSSPDSKIDWDNMVQAIVYLATR